MSEVVTVLQVWFIAFVVGCTLRSFGPAYAYALKMEAEKVYSAEEIDLKRIAIENGL